MTGTRFYNVSERNNCGTFFLCCFSNILIIVTEVNNETFYNVPSPVADPKWHFMNTKHDEVKSTEFKYESCMLCIMRSFTCTHLFV